MKPIIFSTPMVQAILDGRKTQTRRVINSPGNHPHLDRLLCDWGLSDIPKLWIEDHSLWHPWPRKPVKGDWIWTLQSDVDDTFDHVFKCPYGQKSSTLWVREAWKAVELPNGNDGIRYKADNTFLSIPNRRDVAELWLKYWNGGELWRPSIHMPRWAARLFLEITDVRVERVQDISEEDAIAEGVEAWHSDIPQIEKYNRSGGSYRNGFHKLWDSINAKRGYSWAVNPWCWVIKFIKLTGHE
jgi:hypothetical protein